MALTAYKLITGSSNDELEQRVLAAVTADATLIPYGPATYNADAREYMQTLMTGSTAGPTGGSASDVTALQTSVTNLNAWATALATKLNAQFTAANAETTLPFSPALAVDYDTNPQA